MDTFVTGPGIHPGDCLWSRNLGPHQWAFDCPESRYFTIAILGDGDGAETDRTLQRFGACRRLVDSGKAYMFAAVPDPRSNSELEQRFPWIRFLWEADGLARACGAGPQGLWLIADPMQTIIKVGALADSDQAFRRLEGLPALKTASGGSAPAPILILPDVLEGVLCNALIGAFDREGGASTGFMQDVGRTSVQRLDAEWKHRRDVMLSDPALIAAVRQRIGRRVCPAIKKAFQFVATRTERDLVARYDAESGGHFGQHRDDTGNLVAHRRFAVSIPLNDEFDGGGITFPEFGPRSFQAAAGSAIVFSCSLLHKVDPVTRGTRYVFLTFLFDEEAERLRADNFRAAGAIGAPQDMASAKQRVSASFGYGAGLFSSHSNER